MSNYAISLKRTSLLLAALAFTAVLLIVNLSILSIGRADAAQLTSRALSLSSSLGGLQTTGAAGSETNGSSTTHTFTFTMPSAGNVEAVLFKYCTTAISTCTAPTNMSAQSSTLTSETFSTAFANDTTSLESEDAECAGLNGRQNCLGITQATGASESGAQTIVFAGIKNPESIGTFFVRITLYSVDDYTTLLHEGTVASSTTTGIAITSKVVETLGFSTTADDAGDPAETSACVPLTGSGALTLGDVTEGTLSISQAYTEYSAFRLYTNAANGVVVQYEGASLTKGTDVIDAVGGAALASAVGSEQFGLAVDADGGIFTDDTGGFGGAGQVALVAAYNDGEGTVTNGGTASFAFVADTKTTLASASSYVACDTAAVRYIGNISPLTPAGTYTTTIVYFAVPTY